MSQEAVRWISEIRDSISTSKRQVHIIAKSLESINFTLGRIEDDLKKIDERVKERIQE